MPLAKGLDNDSKTEMEGLDSVGLGLGVPTGKKQELLVPSKYHE